MSAPPKIIHLELGISIVYVLNITKVDVRCVIETFTTNTFAILFTLKHQLSIDNRNKYWIDDTEHHNIIIYEFDTQALFF